MKNILLILFCCLIGIKSNAQDPNFHIYLCFGQSNMEGNGVIEAQDKTGVDARFQVMGAVNCNSGGKSYTMGKWQTATPPIFRCNTGLGPADYFGRKMVANLAANIKVGVVPVAIGGCDIALFDKVNYASYVATAPSWMVGNINAYGGNPYARLVEVAKLAQKEGVIKGILLHQGETNNNQSDWPNKIRAIYNNLIADLGLDPTKVPLLAGETVTTAMGGSCGAHNSKVALLPSIIPNAHVVSAANLAHKGDNLHFTPAAYRTLGERYADKMLSLYPKGTPPTVSLTAPSNNSTYTTLQTINLTANATDTDGSISKVEFYDGTTLLGSDNSTPYAFTWSGMIAGVHSLTAKATDNAGLLSTSSVVSVTVTGVQAPFKGVAFEIPGRIQAEEYDLGGQGVAYNEANTNGNQGSAVLRNDEVDIEATSDVGGGYNIGYALNGEWLEYTVNVTNAGQYSLDLRMAADGTGKTLHVEIDGVNVTGAIPVPNTAGWQTWQTVTMNNLNLTAGQKVLRIVFDSDYMNLNYVEFKKMIPTGLEDENAVSSSIFPNPFSADGFQIRKSGNFRYKITDMSGVEIEQGQGQNQQSVGTQLVPGVYLLSIENEGVVTQHKIVRK